MFSTPSLESIISIVRPSDTYGKKYVTVRSHKKGERDIIKKVDCGFFEARFNALGEVVSSVFAGASEAAVAVGVIALGLRLYHGLPF